MIMLEQTVRDMIKILYLNRDLIDSLRRIFVRRSVKMSTLTYILFLPPLSQ